MKTPKEVQAPHGQKMVTIVIKFFTDGIAKKSGHIRRKHAWANGAIIARANKTHGIHPKKSRPFNSLLAIPGTIEAVLKDSGIVLHAFNSKTMSVKQ